LGATTGASPGPEVAQLARHLVAMAEVDALALLGEHESAWHVARKRLEESLGPSVGPISS
jgi:hypothetical protein